MLERLRKRFFPTPEERWQRRCQKWLEFAEMFEPRFPESVAMLRVAVDSPDQFLSSYQADTVLDGHQFPRVFDHTKKAEDVNPEDIFDEVFREGFGVFEFVDWKESNEEIYRIVDAMLRGWGFDIFDWTFKDDHDDETTENFEFIGVVDEQLKGSGYRLVYIPSGDDNICFTVVDDEHYEAAYRLEPYYP